jgi:ferritin-like metal-binding protein YciE
MSDIRADQLESIQRLLVDPLRDAVKTEIQLSHDRLAAAVEKLADRLAGHIDRTEKRIATVEREVSRLRSFRKRLVAIYGVITVILGLLWSAVKDKIMSK